MNLIDPAINNPVLKISNEHAIIIQLITQLETRSNEPLKFFLFLKQSLADLSKQLYEHFVFESQTIFAAAISGKPEIELQKMVMSLEYEHGLMAEKLRILSLLTHLYEEKGEEQFLTLLLKEAQLFIVLIKKHAAKEITEFFVMFERNPKARYYLQKFILSHNSETKSK